jgi:benzoate membrane transport protein
MSDSYTGPWSAISAGIVASLVGFGGTVALLVEAGHALGATSAQTVSWVSALCLGVGISALALSLVYRMPIVTAWSTPGAALIAASAAGISLQEAVGASIVAALATIGIALFRPLGRFFERIPPAIAAAMLAGVLLPFCVSLFKHFGADCVLSGALLVVYVVSRAVVPSFALLAVLAAGIALVVGRGYVDLHPDFLNIATLELVPPVFTPHAVIGLGIPLFFVTLVSQNLPGLAVLQSTGYRVRPGPLFAATGAAWLAVAPFGAHGVNLAALTAAICTGEDAHPDPKRRYLAGITYGLCYFALAAFSAPLVHLFAAIPSEIVAAIAGLALIGPLTSALVVATSAVEDREAATLTFLATASGAALLGIGSAFWGLVIGILVLAAKRSVSRMSVVLAGR